MKRHTSSSAGTVAGPAHIGEADTCSILPSYTSFRNEFDSLASFVFFGFVFFLMVYVFFFNFVFIVLKYTEIECMCPLPFKCTGQWYQCIHAAVQSPPLSISRRPFVLQNCNFTPTLSNPHLLCSAPDPGSHHPTCCPCECTHSAFPVSGFMQCSPFYVWLIPQQRDVVKVHPCCSLYPNFILCYGRTAVHWRHIVHSFCVHRLSMGIWAVGTCWPLGLVLMWDTGVSG